MGAVGVGLGAAGIGGFAPTFGAPGLAPTAGGLGFEAMGGGGLEANALDGRELAGELSEFDVAFIFHGAAVPFPAAIPGNTDTGLAEESAVIDTGATLGAGAFLGGGGGAGGAVA